MRTISELSRQFLKFISWFSGLSISQWFATTVSAFFMSAEPAFGYYLLLIGIIVVDNIFGIIASRVNGIPFSSERLRKGLLDRTLLYGLLLFVFLAVELMIKSVLPYPGIYLTNLIIAFIGIYETTSIIEKLKIIQPGWSFLNNLLRMMKRLQKKTESKVENIFEDKEKEIQE